MATRRNGRAARGRGTEGGDAPAFAESVLCLLERALDLERAVLLLPERPGGPLVAVASVGGARVGPCEPGAEPDGGPWSLVLPLDGVESPRGLLLLARAGGGPLTPADRHLAERLGRATLRSIDHDRVSADLAHARTLLARADRLSALGTLAAGLAHEIRNPLVSVRTFIQLLPERLADEEFRTTFRDLALTEVERICSLITDLLAFSRPSPAQMEPTDLNELVGQIVHLLEAEARRNDVTLSSAGDPGLPLVVVDDAQVKQVLINVILNAIQACPRQGTVEVATRTAADWCVIAVGDSGPGIAPAERDRIFEPFFTTKEAGSGLGLFVARQIVTQHGGDIEAAPRPGGGTVFSVRFPVRASRRDAEASAG